MCFRSGLHDVPQRMSTRDPKHPTQVHEVQITAILELRIVPVVMERNIYDE